MAYNSDNLGCIEPGAGKSTVRIFTYSTADAKATVEGAGYISDAADRGMRVGDVVLVANPDGTEQQWYAVTAISSGAATIDPTVNLT